MKKFGKLIPAFCMLLVSAMLMGTSTFAWFSMNKTVTATGMQVKATVPTQLLISSDNSKWGNTIALAADKVGTGDNAPTADQLKAMAPAIAFSTTKGEVFTETFYRLTASGMKDVNEKGRIVINGVEYTPAAGDIATKKASDGEDAFETTTTDVYKDEMWLKLSGKVTEDNAVGVKIILSSLKEDATDLDKITNALHFVFVKKDDMTVLANVDCGTADEKVSFDTTLKTKTINVADTIHTFTAADEAVDILVYAYYDGQDANCFNNNAVDAEGLIIEIEYTLKAAA